MVDISISDPDLILRLCRFRQRRIIFAWLTLEIEFILHTKLAFIVFNDVGVNYDIWISHI